ncbi:Glycosyl transferase, group 2 family protein [hydrothermal vent metagenome]|uniref:Glycosyl transferase, group 2 family protein n=1 Tax=hydrothermal vent metagenome TaxID=652676 RepID=A0A1W1BSZ7_9ZZZZ
MADNFTPLGRARNLAIEKCCGEWVAFLDCDDLWDREKLELSIDKLNKFQNKEQVSLIYSKAYKIDKDGNTISTSPESPSGEIYEKLIKEGDFIVFSSMIIRRDILLKCGKIDESLNYCEDYDLLLKICRGYQAVGVDKHLTSYRVHSGNITSKKIYENMIELNDFLIKYARENLLSFDIRANIYLNNSYRTLKTIIKLTMASDYHQAGAFASRYIGYLPLSLVGAIKVKIFDRWKKSSYI